MRCWLSPAVALAGLMCATAASAPPLAPQESAVATYIPPAVAGKPFPLSLRSITRESEILGQSPSPLALFWTDDSRWIYFHWLSAGDDWNALPKLWRVPAQGGTPEVIGDAFSDDSLRNLVVGNNNPYQHDVSPDRRWRATAWHGDLYLVNRSSLAIRRLTHTRGTSGFGSVRSPRFSADGRLVYYVQGDQLYSIELASGAVRQLTDIRGGRAPSEEELPGQRAFLKTQQAELFEHIRRQNAREKAWRDQELRRSRTVYTGGMGQPGKLNIDRHGRYVAVQTDQPASPEPKLAMVPQWITADGYTGTEDALAPKVGDGVASSSRLGIHAVGSDSIRWLDIEAKLQAHAAAHAPAGVYLPEQHEAVRRGEVNLAYVSFQDWNDAGTHGLIAVQSRDNKHRWILTVEASSGALTVLHHLADSAWVRSWGTGWLPGSNRVYLVSEATRFAHLYTIEADGSDLRKLTAGEWEVVGSMWSPNVVEIPEQRTHFYLRTNEGSPFHQHVYRMDFDGRNRVRLTAGDGRFEAIVSPDGRRLAIIHSTQNRPPELFVAENRPGAPMRQVTTSPSKEWLAFPWIRAEIIRFPARDGARVPARIYRPAALGAKPNGAAVLYVHGGGYDQNVHEWWSASPPMYMFHHFLAAQGFTVLDVDYRASEGYGRDWRTAIYRAIGGKDLSDYVDAARWLTTHEDIDPQRIGIYGHSYGGALTLMAMFTAPDVFHAGASISGPTDWAHFHDSYTAPILNRPQDDPEAYRRSSPIYHAEGLRGHLLMGHGMVDVAVQFSDAVRLTQRLIELGKENWELAAYPTEGHWFNAPAAWTDLLRRVYELFWRTLSAPECRAGTRVCELPVRTGDN